MDREQIRREWYAALDDAGFPAERCALRLSNRIAERPGVGAQWFQPGMEILPDDRLITETLAEELAAPELVEFHRIVLRRPRETEPLTVARVAAKLRHEIEHARQFEACGEPVFQLWALADDVLRPKLVNLPRGGIFKNLKPVEQDANAAAAMFIRARHPECVKRLLDDEEDAPLVRSNTPPGRLETLEARMIAFLYIYEDLCEELAAPWAIGFDDFLEEIAPGARGAWQTLGRFARERRA